jgi:multidrug efflux pump subunit AcrB
MLWLWNFFLDRRQFSYVLVATLVIAGAYSIVKIPKENTPSIEIPYGIVTTALPGASSADTESLITRKIEDQVGNISNVDKVLSTSGDGLSVVTVEFNANADSNQSIQDLRDAVSKAVPNLPTEATAPSVSKVNLNDMPILVISVAGDLPATEFADLGTSVSDTLKTITGVSRVDVAGVPDRQVTIIVSKELLSSYGLRLVDVISAISASNAPLPAGAISIDDVNYNVSFKGDIKDPNEIGNISIASKNGVPIYLRDIAVISNGLKVPTSYSRISVGNKPSNQAITLVVYKQSGGDISNVANAVKAKVTELQKTTLKNTTVLIAPSTDQSVQISKQLKDLTTTGFETVALVIVVLLLTIGWRESFVAALSIPLSFVIAFVALYFTGNSLNFISFFALILAVGILVDSGIVVTEAIHSRMKLYPTPVEAARAALHDYAWPLIAGTMATVAVFAPLFFISGIVGKYIAGIPYTLIFVLIASIFVALGIVPLIAILFATRNPNRLEQIQEAYTDRVTHWYKKNLRYVLERRRFQNIFLVGLTVLFFGSLALPISGFLPTIFFGQDNQDFVYINITKPENTTLGATDLAVREVEEILYSDPDIASFISDVGRSSDLGGNGGGSSGSNVGNITVNLPIPHARTSTEVLQDLQTRLSVVHDADVQVLEANNGPPNGAPIQIQFTGDDLNALITAADNGKQLLAAIPHVTNITSSTQNNGTEIDLSIDRAKASAVGLNTAIVAQTLRAAINGTKATSITEPGKNIDVVVKLNLNTAYTDPSNTNQTNIDSIQNLTLNTPNKAILLGSILTSSLGLSNAAIAHQDKKRIETVSAHVDSKTTTTAVVQEFKNRIKELNLPAGITVTYGGDTESINKSFSDMFVALIAGLVLMFMILIISFNSIRYTLYLLGIVPLSLIGVLVGLTLSGQSLSFTSILGFIALGGVIINHAIILMDSMIHLHKSDSNLSVIDVVVESAGRRLRPIILTTITTVIGMIPLANSSPAWGPLAYTIMFGLAFAIILTLLLVPMLFYRAGVRDEHKKATLAQM